MITIKAILCSDMGLVRQNNEDMILLNGELYRDESLTTEFNIDDNSRFTAIVADGMGGHEGGEFASELATQAFDEHLSSLPANLSSQQVIEQTKQWAVKTHDMINQKGIELPQYMGMGTTFVGMFSYEGKVFSINIGDSRLYRYRETILKQISQDHSMRNLTGDMTQKSNLIYNSLGAGESVFADVEDMSDKILPDDQYIICSDGLSDMLSDDEIDSLLDNGGLTPELIDAAKRAGGKDNVSVISLHFLP